LASHFQVRFVGKKSDMRRSTSLDMEPRDGDGVGNKRKKIFPFANAKKK
jgi:hypothetical protein